MKKNKPILFDGPHGMPLWDKAEAKGYEKKPVWIYNIEHPDIVEELDREYVKTGAKIVLANTFAANGPAVKASSPYQTADIIKAGMEITKRAIAGSDAALGFAVGPVSEMLEPFGDLSEEECEEIYEEMISAACLYQPEYIYIQTFMDMNMCEIAIRVARRYGLKILASMTFTKSGKTMFGNSAEDVIRMVSLYDVEAVGINCELTPDFMLPIVKTFYEKTNLPLVVKPNAFMTKAAGGSGEKWSVRQYADAVKELLPYVSYIGGCCGADPSYMEAVAALLQDSF